MERADDLETLIVAAPLAVYALDREGAVTVWNASAERMFGWREEEVLGEALPIVPEPRLDEERRLRDEVLAGGSLAGQEARRRRKDGSAIDVSVSISPIHGSDGAVEGLLAFVEDITDRKRAERLLVTQFAVMDVLAASTEFDDVGRSLLGALGYGLGFEVGIVWDADPSGAVLRCGQVWLAEGFDEPSLAEAVGAVELAPGTALPGRAWRSGRTLWEDRVTDHVPLGDAAGLSSAVAFPVLADGSAAAVIELLSRGPGPPDADLVRLLAQVGIQVGQFISRARLESERRRLLTLEQEARRATERAAARTERLQEVLQALGNALTPDDVYEVVLREGIAASGARASLIALLDAPSDELEIVAAYGYPGTTLEAWDRFPVAAALPAAEAVRTRRPVLVTSSRERDARFPELADSRRGGALAVLPLLEKGEPLGALVLSFPDERSFSHDEQALLEALAQAAAQALERARLYRLAERARTHAEAEQERQRLLIEATDTLGSSLNYRLTLRRLAQLAVPRLADWCSVDMLEPDGTIRSLALVHVDPDKVEAARELRRRYPPDAEAPSGPAHVIRSGETEVFEDVTDEMLVSRRRDDEHLRLLRELGMTAIVSVPLTARGRTLGSMSLISAESGRRFGSEDVAFAEELARRAAFAVDNARLFEAERRARREVERLQALTAALSEAVTSEQVGTVVADQAAAAVGADAGAVLLLDAAVGALEVLAASGFEDETVDRFRRLPIDARVPTAESVRTQEPIWIEDVVRASDRWERAAFFGDRAGGAFAAIPLVVAGRVLGTIALRFADARALGPDDRALILSLADQCAQALERARLYEGEQAARESAERAHERIERIQEILEVGLAHLSLDELLEGLLERLTKLIDTDTGTILMLDERAGELRVRASVGVERQVAQDVRVPLGRGVAGTIAATGKPLVLEDVRSARPVSRFLRKSARSLIGVPLRSEEGVIGVLHLTTVEPRAFGEEEVALLEAVAARAGLAIERSRLYEREHQIAETLQRSMLPQEMPDLPGLEIVARYVPGSSGLAIGGDWYDAIALPGGRVGIAVGDIVGKGLRAATEMVQLRNAFRAYALEGLQPAQVLERLNVLVERQGHGQYSTLVYAVFDPRQGVVTFASAGHPPLLVQRPDGSVSFVEGGRSLPLGVAPEVRCEQAETHLGTGSTLLLFTDGLVERRDAGISEGLARLAEAVRTGPKDVAELVDHLVEQLVGGNLDDDVGLIGLRPVSSPSHLSLGFPAEPASLARLRRELRTWLAGLGVDADDIEDITLACHEACANAIEHPVGRRTNDVRLDADVVDGTLSIAVRDSGRWRHPSGSADRGLGLRMIGELMEGVEVDRSRDGTEVRMSRRVGHVANEPL